MGDILEELARLLHEPAGRHGPLLFHVFEELLEFFRLAQVGKPLQVGFGPLQGA